MYQPEGYDMFHMNRTEKKGRGCSTIYKKYLKCKILKYLSVCNDMFEIISVEISVEKAKNITVSCLYRTPGSSLDKFNDSFEVLLSKISVNKKLYLCGDFNIDLLKWESHSGTQQFVDNLYKLGIFPLITKPSRISETSTTLIDNIFTNDLELNYSCGLLINDISDQLPIFLFANGIIKRKFCKEFKTIRRINQDNIELLKSKLAIQDWNNVYSCNNVNLMYENFLEIFCNLYGSGHTK